MIGFDAAFALLGRHAASLGSEEVILADAVGRTLAAPLTAKSDAPRSAVSAMDGYAVASRTCEPGVPFAVIGEARAGSGFDGSVAAGQAVRIFTGAPIPCGTDLVVMQEYATRADGQVVFSPGYGPATHVRPAGGDFRAGTQLLAAGIRLGPKEMVVAAAADVATVLAARRPRVAIFATGDELAPPGCAHARTHAVPESVSFGIAAMVEECGAVVVSRRTGADELEQLVPAANATLDEADLVVVTGGASVGDRDFARAMFVPQGLALIFDKVAMKPGKPVWLGMARDRLILGLPGNPTSAMVTAALFLRPLLALLQGGDGSLIWRTLRLAGPLGPTGGRETFVRASWEAGGLVPVLNQDSGAQAALAQADWLIHCPPHQKGLDQGAEVTAMQF